MMHGTHNVKLINSNLECRIKSILIFRTPEATQAYSAVFWKASANKTLKLSTHIKVFKIGVFGYLTSRGLLET